jgi:hypothetical protein
LSLIADYYDPNDTSIPWVNCSAEQREGLLATRELMHRLLAIRLQSLRGDAEHAAEQLTMLSRVYGLSISDLDVLSPFYTE